MLECRKGLFRRHTRGIEYLEGKISLATLPLNPFSQLLIGPIHVYDVSGLISNVTTTLLGHLLPTSALLRSVDRKPQVWLVVYLDLFSIPSPARVSVWP